MTTMLDHDDDGAPVRLTEGERVDAWRENCLTRMGFEYDQVTLLLFAEVDLGSVRDLLLRGATHDQTIRILV